MAQRGGRCLLDRRFASRGNDKSMFGSCAHGRDRYSTSRIADRGSGRIYPDPWDITIKRLRQRVRDLEEINRLRQRVRDLKLQREMCVKETESGTIVGDDVNEEEEHPFGHPHPRFYEPTYPEGKSQDEPIFDEYEDEGGEDYVFDIRNASVADDEVFSKICKVKGVEGSPSKMVTGGMTTTNGNHSGCLEAPSFKENSAWDVIIEQKYPAIQFQKVHEISSEKMNISSLNRVYFPDIKDGVDIQGEKNVRFGYKDYPTSLDNCRNSMYPIQTRGPSNSLNGQHVHFHEDHLMKVSLRTTNKHVFCWTSGPHQIHEDEAIQAVNSACPRNFVINDNGLLEDAYAIESSDRPVPFPLAQLNLQFLTFLTINAKSDMRSSREFQDAKMWITKLNSGKKGADFFDVLKTRGRVFFEDGEKEAWRMRPSNPFDPGCTSSERDEMIYEVEMFRRVVMIVNLNRVDVPFDPGGLYKTRGRVFFKNGSMMQEHLN